MLTAEIIRAKRDRQTLSPKEIGAFVRGVADGSVTDAQIAAFAMAAYLNGLNEEETVDLTLAMRDSGDTLDWSDMDRSVSDKHSTGGVGDNVSLMLAPIAAACGLAVPMISGRGLGHTGGTLDKLEAIPGYNTTPDNQLFRKTVAGIGCAIIGQTSNLAPADKRIYGVRDVTATVENIPLITASILAKKLAAGLGSLVLDVKSGSGAFMAAEDQAVRLAESLVGVADGAGTNASAVLTDMNQPLASAAGNAVEVLNAVQFLTGEKWEPRLLEVTLTLATEMIIVSGVETENKKARAKAESALESGSAAEVFAKMVSALGGPADFVDRATDYLPRAPVIVEVLSEAPGYISSIDTREVGLAVVSLGGGRERAEDAVDHSVGLTDVVELGTSIEAGDALAVVHAATAEDAEKAASEIRAAITLGDTTPIREDVIKARIGR